MSLLIIIGIIYAVCELTSYSAKRREARRKEAERKMREEIARQKAETQALLRKQREMEREQARIAKEQERQRKEQKRQAAQLAKHEEQIAKLTFRMERAEQDIEFLDERLRNLTAKRDNYMAQQSACAPNSAEWDKWQTKIISLDSQINSAESRLAKAKFTHEQAKAKLSA